MIRINDLLFKYDESGFVLNISQLDIKKGEKVAFVGPSGCGKTTLLYLLAGICRPLQGEVNVADNPIHSLQDVELRNFRSSHLGFIFQQFELLEYLNGKENILLTNYINNSLTIDPDKLNRVLTLSKAMGVFHLLSRSNMRNI